MNNSTPAANESCCHDCGSVSQPVESFVDDVLQCLSQTDAPESAVSDLRGSGEALLSFVEQQQQQAHERAERVETLENELSEAQEHIDELEQQLTDERETRAKEDAEIRGRVTSVEENAESQDSDDDPRSPDDTPTSQPGSPPTQTPQTPLEEVTRLPEHMAESELTANADRARAVFRDVLDYTESVPKGRAIATPDLRRVLTALKDDGTACYKTVSRVVDFLTELGGDDVRTTERMNGDTVVVFSEDICRRRAARQNATDSVVTTERVAD